MARIFSERDMPLRPQIYGELFDVRVTHDPINLAYSTEVRLYWLDALTLSLNPNLYALP